MIKNSDPASLELISVPTHHCRPIPDQKWAQPITSIEGIHSKLSFRIYNKVVDCLLYKSGRDFINIVPRQSPQSSRHSALTRAQDFEKNLPTKVICRNNNTNIFCYFHLASLPMSSLSYLPNEFLSTKCRLAASSELNRGFSLRSGL